MEVQISKWGNSLGLRIPKDIALSAGFEEGSRVEITTAGQDVVLTKVKRKSKYTLEALLADTTPDAYRNALDPEFQNWWQSTQGREHIED